MRALPALFFLAASACTRASAQSIAPPAPRPPASPPGPTSPPPAPLALAPAPAWYDAAPLLASLRPQLRASVGAALGVTQLEQLPLYDLELGLAPDQSTFALRETLWFTNTETAPLAELVFRVYANTTPPQQAARAVRLPSVRLRQGSCELAGCSVAAEAPDVVAVRLAAPLAPGARVRVRLELEGTLDAIDASRTNLLSQAMEGMASLGSTESAGNYGLLAHGEGIASLANFFPVLARRSQGQWERREQSTMGDLGTDAMAHVRARIRTAPGVRVFTSGVTVSERDEPASGAEPARRTSEVVAAAVRDFAVLASAELAPLERDVGGVRLRSLCLPADRAAGQRVLDAAASAFELYQQRFGEYPYVDLDLVEAPLVGGAGGVEFSGLATVASMFYRPALPSGGTGGLLAQAMQSLGSNGPNLEHMVESMLEFVTAHEVAHQWWHGIVGSDSRAHPFVDESLAQWSAVLYMESRYGAERGRREADAQVRMNYQLMRQLGRSDGAVDRPVAAFGSPLEYAGLVYGKGAYLYPALRQLLGDTAFFAGLRAYVSRYRFRLAPPRGLLELLAQGPNAARVRALGARWLEQSHGDEDLGRGDLGTILGNAMGGQGASPELQQAMQMLAPMLNGGGLGGLAAGAQGAAGPGRAAASGGPGNGGQPSPAEMQELMQALQGILGGAGGSAGAGGGAQGGATEEQVQQLLRQLQGATP